MGMLRVVSLPFCQVVMLDRWDAPPSRYFAAYAARGSARWMMGHPVVDEFATISSPIFLTPRPLLGKIYNAGISLGHLRDSEMALDLGWPPFCAGVDLPAPELPANWHEQMLQAVTGPTADDRTDLELGVLKASLSATHEVEAYRIADAMVMAVSEPLLPRQLRRLCETVTSPLAMAVAVGNHLGRSQKSAPQTIQAVSETKLAGILKTGQGLV